MSEQFTIDAEQRKEILRQIGTGNLLAISGGRVVALPDGVELPVSYGYHVRVQLTPVDDYTVTRIFRRSRRDVQHGQMSSVYADTVGNAAYYAGMYRSYSATEWPEKAAVAA